MQSQQKQREEELIPVFDFSVLPLPEPAPDLGNMRSHDCKRWDKGHISVMVDPDGIGA